MNHVSGKASVSSIPNRGNPQYDEWAIKHLTHGWHPQAVATACGVSLRTAYRWKAEIVGFKVVEVDGWEATFALRRSKGPQQLTPWRVTPLRSGAPHEPLPRGYVQPELELVG